MKAIVVAVAVLVVSSMAAFAQAGSRPSRTESPERTALLAQVKVSLSDSKIVLSAKSAKRGLVTFKVTNTGARTHDFSINGRKTKALSHGQSNTLRVIFLRKGAYPYKSTQPGDAAKGLTGVFTIK
jgi:hypothetical protein